MPYFIIEFWVIILDVIGICFCGITIFYLLKNKISFNKNSLKEEGVENSGNFNELLFQVLGQSEIAFESISDTIKKERRVLQEMIEKQIKNEGNPLLEKDSKQIKKNLREKNIKTSDVDNSISDLPHGEVQRLADMGLGVKEISERVKIPKGEIELILKFRRLGHEY